MVTVPDENYCPCPQIHAEVGGGRTNGKRERRVDNVQIRNGQLDLSRRGLRTAATNRDKRSGRLPRRESAPPLWSVLGSWVKPCRTRLGIRKGEKGAVRLPKILVLI